MSRTIYKYLKGNEIEGEMDLVHSFFSIANRKDLIFTIKVLTYQVVEDC